MPVLDVEGLIPPFDVELRVDVDGLVIRSVTFLTDPVSPTLEFCTLSVLEKWTVVGMLVLGFASCGVDAGEASIPLPRNRGWCFWA